MLLYFHGKARIATSFVVNVDRKAHDNPLGGDLISPSEPFLLSSVQSFAWQPFRDSKTLLQKRCRRTRPLETIPTMSMFTYDRKLYNEESFVKNFCFA